MEQKDQIPLLLFPIYKAGPNNSNPYYPIEKISDGYIQEDVGNLEVAAQGDVGEGNEELGYVVQNAQVVNDEDIDLENLENTPQANAFENRRLYLTIPMKYFKPCVGMWRDFIDDPEARDMKFLMYWFYYMAQTNFFNDGSRMVGGRERCTMYIQYIPSSEYDPNIDTPETMTFNKFAAVRFIMVVRDHELKFNDVFNKMVAYNESMRGAKKKAGRSSKVLYLSEMERLYSIRSYLDGFFETIKNYIGLDDCDTSEIERNFDVTTKLPTENSNYTIEKVFGVQYADCNSDLDDIGIIDTQGKFNFPHFVFRVPMHDVSYLQFPWYKPPLAVGWKDNAIEDIRQYKNNMRYFEDDVLKKHEDFLVRKTSYDAFVEESAKEMKGVELGTERYFKVTARRSEILEKIFYCKNEVAKGVNPIAEYAKTLQGKPLTLPNYVRNKNLSKFGNAILLMYESFEFGGNINTTHSEFLLILCSAFDSLRYDFKLKFNIVIAGNAGVGKSFMLDLVEKLLIDGTVVKNAHTSKLSDTNDIDENCLFEIQHEMNSNFKKGANDDSTGNSALKTRLTEQVVNSSTLTVIDGRRVKVEARSEKIGSMTIATNDNVYDIAEPFHSRALIIQFIKVFMRHLGGYYVKNRNNKRRHDESVFENCVDSELTTEIIRAIQVNMCIIELMITSKLIPDVDMSCFDFIYDKMFAYLHKHEMINKHTDRDKIIYRALTRKLVMIGAIVTFFNESDQQGYNTPWSFDIVRHISPLLFCTTEIAYFALSLCSKFIFNYHISIVLAHVLNILSHEISMPTGVLHNENGYISVKLPKGIAPGVEKLMACIVDDGDIGMENIESAITDAKKVKYKRKAIIMFDGQNDTNMKVNYQYIVDTMNFERRLDGFFKFENKYSPFKAMNDVYEKAVVNKYTEERSIITAEPINAQYPHILKHVTIEKNNQDYSDRLPYCDKDGNTHVTIAQDYEKYAYDAFNETYGYEPQNLHRVQVDDDQNTEEHWSFYKDLHENNIQDFSTEKVKMIE